MQEVKQHLQNKMTTSNLARLNFGATQISRRQYHFITRNLGVFSGKYLIKSSHHTIYRNQGYTTTIDVRLLEFIADDLVTQSMEKHNANP